jgi:hypothetical protein
MSEQVNKNNKNVLFLCGASMKGRSYGN